MYRHKLYFVINNQQWWFENILGGYNKIHKMTKFQWFYFRVKSKNNKVFIIQTKTIKYFKLFEFKIQKQYVLKIILKPFYSIQILLHKMSYNLLV